MALPISARARVLPSMSSTSVLVADGWTVDIEHLSSTVPVNVSRTWAGKQAYQDLASCSVELVCGEPAPPPASAGLSPPPRSSKAEDRRSEVNSHVMSLLPKTRRRCRHHKMRALLGARCIRYVGPGW